MSADETMTRVAEMIRDAEHDIQAESEARPAPDEDTTTTENRPGSKQDTSNARLFIEHNKAILAPFTWMTAADIIAAAAHYPGHMFGWWGPSATILTATAAIAIRTFRHIRPSRLAKVVKTTKTRCAIIRDARVATAAGTVWGLTAANWTLWGPHGLLQLLLFGGGVAISTPHLWRNRRRPRHPEVEAPAAIEAPTPAPAPTKDPRIIDFRARFCRTGVFRAARLYDLESVPSGFAFNMELHVEHKGTFDDIKGLRGAMAAYYDVPVECIGVEPPEGRSFRRAHITILTESDAHEREQTWDGTSTYDPKTGCFELGRFADSSASRWQLHVPYSGAAGGASVGKIGSGKTGTLHVVACEAGQARMCARCLAEQRCQRCDPRRVAAIWMGDPQRQPFGVYRGKADLTAWGPIACVRMLYWVHTAMRSRADWFGRMEWTDHLGRSNTGKGWFDPEPGLPLIYVVIDEWPMITSDPELGSIAVKIATEILRESRKVGLTLVLGAQDPDVDVFGDRDVRNALTAFNTCIHRIDRLGKQMLEIEGNPTELAPGIPGLSFLNGIDRRSGVPHRTKSIREYLRPGETGVDVREIVERIATEPVTYDQGILRAIQPLGYTGPGQVLADDDGWHPKMIAADAAKNLTEAGAAEPDQAAAPARLKQVTHQDVTAVQRVLNNSNGGVDVYGLMEATDLTGLTVSQAVDALIAHGEVEQTPTGSYRCVNQRG